jgi:TldD protein
MERRAFLNISSLALGTMLLPAFGRASPPKNCSSPSPSQFKKMLADTALTPPPRPAPATATCASAAT